MDKVGDGTREALLKTVPPQVAATALKLWKEGGYVGMRLLANACVYCLRQRQLHDWGVFGPTEPEMRAATDGRVVVYGICEDCAQKAPADLPGIEDSILAICAGQR